MMKTVCGYCGVGCGLIHDDEKLAGDKEYPSNHGLSCAKGSSSLQSVASDNRLTTPQIKTEQGWEDIGWERAIELIAERIQASSPERMALYLSGQLLTEDYYIANKLGKGFLGTNNVDTNSRMCMSSAVVAYKKIFGVDYVPLRMSDIDHCDLLILAGANTAEAHVVFNNKIKKAKKKGLKTVVIDPRRTETAQQADLHLAIKPGSDIDFLTLVAHRIINDGKANTHFLEHHVDGTEPYLEQLSQIDSSLLLDRCGLCIEELDSFMQLFYGSENIISAWTMGLNQSVQGVDKNIALINLHLLTGKINKPGNGPLSLTGQPNAMGGREVGGLSTMLAVHLDFDENSVRKVSAFWQTDRIDNKPGLTSFEMIEAAERGELDVLIISHTDPVYHLPNRSRVEAALANIPFIVEINAYDDSQTKPFAHLRLPAAPWGEKEGTQTNLDRTVTHQAKLFERRGDCKPDWEIFALIGQRLGFSEAFDYRCAEEIFDEYKAMTKLSRDGHLDYYAIDNASLKNRPFIWGEQMFLDHQYHTPTGKANLIFVSNALKSEQPSADYPFVLLTGRIRDQWHSGTKTSQVGALHKHKPLSFVEIHPDIAKKLGIEDGEYVKVFNARGSLELKSRITDTIQPANLFIPVTERNINYLTNDLLDPFSKEPDFNHSAVNIAKL